MGLLARVDQFMPPRIKVLTRAILSPYIGFTPARTWEEATDASHGYESNVVIHTMYGHENSHGKNFSLTLESRHVQIVAALGVAIQQKETLRVLDVGGARGEYFEIVQNLFSGTKIDWTVLETPSLVPRTVSERRGNSQITWTSEQSTCIGPFDVVLLSSVLQYVEKPNELLQDMSRLTSKLIINRLPLISGLQDEVAVQHLRMYGRRGSYPAWFFSESRFLEAVGDLGHVTYRWISPSDTHVFRWKEVPCQGMLITLNKLGSVG